MRDWIEEYIGGSDDLEELIRLADMEIETSRVPYRVCIRDREGNIVYERVTDGIKVLPGGEK